MIYVDACRPCGAPWRGGVACHMVSDTSLDELLVMAERLNCPRWWLQQPPRASVHHFDLSPKLRARAVELGAFDGTWRDLALATRRFRAANPALFPAAAQRSLVL